eukprot:m.146304 g.146304  ORF g.146304 m.146304 type:complete len:209 (-) comp23099_c1_seq3:34-660(-)
MVPHRLLVVVPRRACCATPNSCSDTGGCTSVSLSLFLHVRTRHHPPSGTTTPPVRAGALLGASGCAFNATELAIKCPTEPLVLYTTYWSRCRMGLNYNTQPCNTSGWFDPELAGKYGLVDFDWSTGRDIWANGKPMNNGVVLNEQVAKVKAVNPTTHVWVYRNLVKALSWYTEVTAAHFHPFSLGVRNFHSRNIGEKVSRSFQKDTRT